MAEENQNANAQAGYQQAQAEQLYAQPGQQQGQPGTWQQPGQQQAGYQQAGQPYAQQAQQQYAQPGYQQPQQPGCQPQPGAFVPGQKSKVAAGVLGILLGSLGIHKFYLGYTTQGVIMLVVSLVAALPTLGISSAVMGIIGLVEGIVYLTKTDEEFYYTYELNRKPWF